MCDIKNYLSIYLSIVIINNDNDIVVSRAYRAA